MLNFLRKVKDRPDDASRPRAELSSETSTTWKVSPHLLSVIDLGTGKFVRVNPAWTSTLGWREAELAGKPFYDFLHPDDMDASRDAWEKVRHGDAVLNFENRYRTKSGETRVLSWVAVPVDGFLYSTARDVTAERALRDSEGQFRTMAQAMPHHVWTAPASGMLDWFNDRVYEYSGKARGTLDGAGWTSIVHPDDLADAGARWAQALSSGEIYEAEFRLQRADGAYRWHIARAVPIRDEGGNITRWIGTNTDIEDERQIRLKLSAAQDELSVLLNSVASAFFSVDRDGITTSVNAAFLKILGFDDMSAVAGKNLHDLIHHSFADGTPYPAPQCPVAHCARRAIESYVADEIFFRKDGSQVPVEYWVRPLYRDGVHTGAICNFNDISERKNADAQRGLLLSELNHRVKNLFALVGGIVSLSARDVETPKELATVLQGRLGALTRAHELIQPGLRGHDKSMDSADLESLIGQIFAPYASSHTEGRVEVSGPPIALSGSAVTGMALIFHELATNAAKYGALHAAEGKIAVTWRKDGDMLALNWHETGCPPRPEKTRNQGFGSVLLRRSVESQFGGTLDYRWNDDGLDIAITAALARL